jgi:tetratricopeptide (TPR) repeat protein
MKHVATFISLFLLSFTIFAQSETDKSSAHELCIKGIQEMEKGEIEKSIQYFEQAKSLEPNNFFYPYEIAHSYYLTKQYKKAIRILEPLLSHKDVTDHAYHLLGSSYELLKNTSKGVDTYQAGLERFPNSGILYYELGNFYVKKQNYKEALVHYEKGIAAEPDFSLNYFYASKVHASLEDKLWGIMYAELFINMEGVNDKSLELSKMIYDVFEKGIVISHDTVLVNLADSDNSAKNFESEFEDLLSQSSSKLKNPITIEAINQARTTFTLKWIENGNNNRFPNILLDWQSLLLMKGYFEPYNYWLLKEGNPSEFNTWKENNAALYNEFINWLSENSLTLSSSNYFVAKQYSE